MRLLIDLQGCQNGSRYRGIGRSSLALAKALVRNAGEHEVFLLLNGLFADTLEPLRQEFDGLLHASRVLVFHAPGPVDELRPENAGRKHAAELLRENLICDFDPDAVFVLSMVEGSMDDTVSSIGWLSGRSVNVALLHDLIPLLDPDRYINWPPLRRWYMDKVASLKRCDLLLSVSGSARREAVTALHVDPSRVVNISSAADPMFEDAQVAPAELAVCQARFAIDRPYLMHAGAVEPRKNFDGLIRAFGALTPDLRKRYQLVLVGKFSAESRADLEELAQMVGMRPQDLVLTGHVTDIELIALYAGCHLFVYPSLHEGFGLPVLEAMHFGVPVIGSNTTSIPEVIGRADALFDPRSVPDITARITRCLVDSAFHADLQRHSRERCKEFSWNSSARTALSALEHAVMARRAEAATGLSAPARLAATLGQLVAPPALPPPDTDGLVRVAQSLARNEAAVQRLRAHGVNEGALRWRLEGPFDSSYSLALVNRESARALEALGHSVMLHSTEGPGDITADPAFLAANPDLAAMHHRAAANEPTACDVLSRNLYPPRVAGMQGGLNILHQYAWEETGFPPDWVEQFNRHLQGITCTSTHVQKVLIDNGVHVPIAVVGNGVDHWERITATRGLRFPGKRFRFLHVSSCFPRKGADVMLQAYGDAFSSADDVSLLIKTFANPHNDIHAPVTACRAANPHFPDVQILENDLTDADLKALYLDCHVLVAPSRAEGFGLPMAEAMLTGLPVITTDWSGQLDFCSEDNAWLVDTRFTATKTHFDLAGSVWAEPDRAGLARALRHAHAASDVERRRRADHGRAVLLEHYRWIDVTARAVAAVRQWRSAPAAEAVSPRVGWVTTWNTRCGIASYARHIVKAAGAPTAVLAPREAGLLSEDEPFVRRCWLSGKHGNAFDDLSAAVRELALDVIVVQFNYAFFNFHHFSDFLHAQVDEGRVVIVTMHATWDPASLAGQDDNWALRTALPGLSRCDRLLVHSLDDLNRLKAVGVSNNVSLFPHPLWDLPADGSPKPPQPGTTPLVATFGYCLPHKGLSEMLQAAARLKRQGFGMRLLMLNAEFPDPVSARLVAQLRTEIHELGLQADVDLRTDYLGEADVATLLAQVDLIVFPYQDTQESASGAVRHGLAAARPLLVTPLPIFAELGAGVYRSSGISAEALAAGIGNTLADLASGTPRAREVGEQAARWRAHHAVGNLAARLMNMARGLRRLRPAKAVANAYSFDGSNRQLQGDAGEPEHRATISDGRAGTLCLGPWVSLPGGHYEALLRWDGPPKGGCRCTVAALGGSQLLADVALAMDCRTTELRIPFELATAAADLEVRVLVDKDFEGKLLSLTLQPASAAIPAAPVVRPPRSASAASRT